MRAREAIEADLEILTWPHVVLDAAVVYDRLLRDVAPLLAALDEATRRAELRATERDALQAEVERLTTQLALRDLACELGGAEVRYERARADVAVQALADQELRHATMRAAFSTLRAWQDGVTGKRMCYAEDVLAILDAGRRAVSEGSSE